MFFSINVPTATDSLLTSVPHNVALCDSSQIPGHATIFVNELKLSDFKQVLLRNGVQAEFSGGVLYCNGIVAVRRVRHTYYRRITLNMLRYSLR